MRLRDIKLYVTNTPDSNHGWAFVKEPLTDGIYSEHSVDGVLHEIIMSNTHIVKVYDPWNTMSTDKHLGLLQLPI